MYLVDLLYLVPFDREIQRAFRAQPDILVGQDQVFRTLFLVKRAEFTGNIFHRAEVFFVVGSLVLVLVLECGIFWLIGFRIQARLSFNNPSIFARG